MPTAFSTKSLVFGGTDEYVTMGNVLAFERTDSFSFSLWFKTTQTSYGALIVKGASTTAQGYHLLIDASGRIELWLISDFASVNYIQVRTVSSYNDGRWHHLTVSYSGTSLASGISIYIDGFSASKTTVVDALSASIVSTATLRLGGRDAGDIWLVGSLDEVAVYNKALAVAERTWLYNSRVPRDLTANGAPSNLVAWWRCGEGDSFATTTIYDQGLSAVPNDVRDIAGNNYTGTMTNMEVGDVVVSAAGEERRSVAFGGTDEYVTMGDVLGFEYTQAFSVGCWTRHGIFTSYCLYSKMGGANLRGYACTTSTGRYTFTLQNDSATSNRIEVRSRDILSTTDWRHVLWTYDGSNTAAGLKCYINGEAVALEVVTDALTGTILNTTDFRLGARGDGARFLVGNLDEVAVYNRVLSATEAAWFYNAGVRRPSLAVSGAPPDLVAWWRMGEAPDAHPTLQDFGQSLIASTVRDLSGNAYTGTMTNMEQADLVSDAPGRNKSLLFDGVDEYVDMGNVLGFERTDPFSISFWFKTTSTSTQYLLGKMSGATDYRGYAVAMDDEGTLALILRNNTTTRLIVKPYGFYNDGVWHHCVCATGGLGTAADTHVYIDGFEPSRVVDADNLSGTIVTTAPFWLGGMFGESSTLFEGNLDEVAIYGRALAQAEVTWLFNNRVPQASLTSSAAPPNLLAWWKMGDGDAYPVILDSCPNYPAGYPAVADFSGNNNHGAMVNMEAGDVTSGSPGGNYSSKYLTFDGVNEYVQIGDRYGYDYNQTFSISVWFKTTTTTSSYLVSKKTDLAGVYRGYGLLARDTGVLTFFLTNDGSTPGTSEIRVDTVSTYNDGVWHHVVVTWDGNASPGAAGVLIYVDGSAVSTSTVYNTLGTNTIRNVGTFNLAARTSGGGGLFAGTLDEVAIYNKTLSAGEVTWLYNSGAPRDLKNASAPSNLQGWWRCGEPLYNGLMLNMESSDIVQDTPGMAFTTKSMRFEGTNEYINCGSVLAFERTNTFSVSAWVKYTTAAYQAIIGNLDPSTTYRGWELTIGPSGEVYLQLVSDLGTSNYILGSTTPTAYNDGNWHHIVATYSGGSLSSNILLYVDGASVALTYGGTLSATIVGSTPLAIGGRSPGPAACFTGKMAEVSVYNKVLSANEVKRIYNNGVPFDLSKHGSALASMVAWWRLGGAAFVGTMTNMEAGDIAADSPGKGSWATNSLLFGGTDEYVTLGNVLAFERTNPFAISFWFKSVATDDPYIINKMGGATAYRGYGVVLTAAGALSFVLRSDNATTNRIIVTTTPNGFNDNAWHHCVWSYGGLSTAASVRCYIDGVEVALTVVTDALSGTIVTTDPLWLGAAGYGGVPGSYYVGNLDEVAVFSRALTASEAAWLYNSGVPRNLKDGGPTVLSAYWRMGESAYPGTLTNMESTDIQPLGAPRDSTTTLAYTWRFKNNIDLNTTGTRIGDFRQLLLAMKNALITASGWTDSTGTAATLSTPWTVVASSNGVTASAADNWSVATDLVWANSGTAHSWIVLRQTGITGNAELCIDLNITATDYQISLAISEHTGFDVTSPSILNRPTVTASPSDEFLRYNANTWTGLSAAFSGILNVAVSDDGSCTRIWFYTAGTVRFFWLIDYPDNANLDVWDYPSVFLMCGGNEPTYANLNDSIFAVFRGIDSTNKWGWFYLATESYAAACVGERQTTVSDITSEWPITRISLVSESSGIAGRHGELTDIWYGATTPANGDTYPAIAPLKQYVQVGDLILPWDRSTPVTS